MPLVPGETDAHHRAIVEAAVDAILAIDSNGIVQFLNPAAERLFGYAAAEVLGENVRLLMPSPYREEHDGYIRRYLESGEKRIIGIGREVVGRRKDGSTFPMHLSVAEFFSGERRLFAGIIRDLTEVKRAEAAREELLSKLERTNAELERFTYTVSHDLKSPLITIRGFLGILEEDSLAGDHESVKRSILRIGNAADKMQELLEDLLELSRVGRVANPFEQVSLTDVARDAAEILSGPIRERQAVVRIDPDLPTVRGDRVRLREVWQNLLENALKFSTQDRPTVEVGARQDGGDSVLFVRDQGIGLDPRHMQRIFGLFEQLGSHTPGTGIGLALVKRIVEVHGGRIWAESEGLGKGTTICFTVPGSSS